MTDKHEYRLALDIVQVDTIISTLEDMIKEPDNPTWFIHSLQHIIDQLQEQYDHLRKT